MPVRQWPTPAKRQGRESHVSSTIVARSSWEPAWVLPYYPPTRQRQRTPNARQKNMSDSRLVNCGSFGRALASSADQGDSLMPEYLEKSEFQAARAYSPAVITQGGRI